MKNLLVTIAILLISITHYSAQEIRQNEVPSVILNHFQKSFPKASDIEWEIKDRFYEVEFETGYGGDDHKVLYSKEGRMIKHVEEISRNKLPKSILNSVRRDFYDYKIDDVKKIYENGKIIYKLELKNHSKECKVVFDSNAKVLHKKED